MAPVARTLVAVILACCASHTAALAESSVTDLDVASRYERAAAVQRSRAGGWPLNTAIQPIWIEGTASFYYKETTSSGYRFRLVDATKRTNSDLFDHRRLADRLAKATGKEVSADELPVFRLLVEDGAATFEGLGKRWRYEIGRNRLSEEGTLGPPGSPPEVVSPDGRKAVFRRDTNIWVRDIESGEETQLTTDGEPYYEYGIDPDATGRAAASFHAIWSPDSTKILTHQTDDRQIEALPMVEFAPKDGTLRPRAFSFRTSLPGDQHVTTFRMTVIDVDGGTQVSARYPTIVASRMFDTPVSGNRAWWSKDSTKAYFVEIERFEKHVNVVEFDTTTGHSHVVFEESTSDGYLELGSNVYTPTSILPLPESDQLIWYSERSGWAHLYLYHLRTGEKIRDLTSGDWLVRDVIGVDRKSRDLFLTRAGHDASIDPYYRQVVRVDLDSAALTELSGGNADHFVPHERDFGAMLAMFVEGADPKRNQGLSPNGDYYVETVQRIDALPRTILRDRNGQEVMTVVETDMSAAPEWFTAGEPFQTLAADEETPISGVLMKPSTFDPDKQYPVIDYIYGGPQVSHVPESIGDMNFMRARTLAELGFVVVIIDGRGTIERSREFRESSYSAVHTASDLEDHIAAIRQLAEKYEWIDDSRVGITGFSGGGYMTASAMLRFPEFFDVGVAGAGNHDQRLFWSTWGERYHGAVEGDNYAAQANLTYAGNLEGKLLFIHGLLDYGVHPAALFQLTQALIDANKDFDLILLPQAAHSLNGWAERRLWDYFVTHLAGEEPPETFAGVSIAELFEAEIGRVMTLRYGIEPPPLAEAESAGDE